jgi:hypothetical protein
MIRFIDCVCGKCDFCIAKDDSFVDIPICPPTIMGTNEMTALKCAIEHSRVSDPAILTKEVTERLLSAGLTKSVNPKI